MPTVNGILAVPLTGSNAYDPYGVCGRGEAITFDTQDVAAMGKLTTYGNARVSLYARLKDGRTVHFRICDQEALAQKALQKISRKAANPCPPRNHRGDWMQWTEFEESPPPPALIAELRSDENRRAWNEAERTRREHGREW